MAKREVPRHVGIIMDGNGRWAKRRLMPRSYGHSAGMKTLIEITRCAAKMGIPYLTVYALSTENIRNRPADELEGLYGLLREYFTNNVKTLYESGARVKVIGDLDGLPQDIAKLLRDGEANSPQNATFTLTFAINYGSRAEIVSALEKLAASGEKVSEESISRSLYTSGMPDPDLIIRTGGEVRLSNFLLWQSAYAELYFCDVLFPDFTPKEFEKAINAYMQRHRRFGGV